MSGGTEMSLDEIMAQVDENDFNVTLSGGDPLMQIDGVMGLVKRLKHDGRNVWCFTGYTYEEVAGNARYADLLNYIDVLVDGPFVADLRDISLRFRGSSNQRLVDVRRSTPGNVTLWQ
jgi:anaerobic ribonucleoside-triphosphate reductase activating protein